jgi:peptidoglycan/LPS O-acetylase OafA/YrhL
MSMASARVPSLDGWRGLAITSLLLGHFVPAFDFRARLGINAGRLGVELFFVLSGLLMGNLLFVQRVSIGTFYKKRVSRIFPALYFYLIAVTIALAVLRHVWSVRSLCSIFFLYFNYYAALTNLRVPDEYQHIWSLCIEEHCYVLLSLVAVTCRRTTVKDYAAIAVLTVVSWGFAIAYSVFTDWNYYQLFWRTEARIGAVFVSAGLTCWLRDAGRPLLKGAAFPAVFALSIALQTRWVPDVLKYTLGSALLALCVTHLYAAPALIRRAFEWPLLTTAGVLSYSIYLWQQPFMVLSEHRPKALCLAGALVLGAASFRLLENPARRWINARWARS